MTTFQSGYSVHTYKLSAGERLPVLLRNGLPQYWPTLWVSAKRRKCRVAARTLALDLRSVMLVLEWAEEEGFSLEARLVAGGAIESVGW